MSMSCYMCNLEGTVSWQDAAAPQQTTKKTKAKASSNTDSQQQMIPAISFGLKYPPGPDDSKWSDVPSVKILNKMTDTQAHAFIAVPEFTIEKYELMRTLNFTNWTDFRQNMDIPERVVRDIQTILKNDKEEIEKFWLKKSLDQIAAYVSLPSFLCLFQCPVSFLTYGIVPQIRV